MTNGQDVYRGVNGLRAKISLIERYGGHGCALCCIPSPERSLPTAESAVGRHGSGPSPSTSPRMTWGMCPTFPGLGVITVPALVFLGEEVKQCV